MNPIIEVAIATLRLIAALNGTPQEPSIVDNGTYYEVAISQNSVGVGVVGFHFEQDNGGPNYGFYVGTINDKEELVEYAYDDQTAKFARLICGIGNTGKIAECYSEPLQALDAVVAEFEADAVSAPIPVIGDGETVEHHTLHLPSVIR